MIGTGRITGLTGNPLATSIGSLKVYKVHPLNIGVCWLNLELSTYTNDGLGKSYKALPFFHYQLYFTKENQ